MPMIPLPFDGSQNCSTTDPEVFFPVHPSVESRAKSFCQSCRLKDPCLEYALRVNVEGVWGGTNEDERKQIRRRRKARPVAVFQTFDPAPPSPEAMIARRRRADRTAVAV